MSGKVSTATTYILRKLWMLVAILLVGFALIMSAMRYSLPLLDERKSVIEEYVNTEYGINLDIGNISADWQPSGPSLVLLDVDMRQGEKSPLTLNVGELKLLIDFWPSILNFKLQSKNVQLSKLHLQLDIEQMEQGDSDFAIVKAVESVFLEQLANFSVSDSKLTLIANGSERTIRIDELNWLNKEKRHQGWGFLSLDNFATTGLSFVLDLQGDVDNYSGTFYSEGNELDVSPWLNDFVNLDAALTDSDVNFAFWAKIKNGGLERIHSNIKPSKLSWNKQERELASADFSLQIAAEKVEEEWLFNADNLLINLNQSTIESFVSGRLNKDDEVFVNVAGVDNAQYLLPFLSVLNEQAYQSINRLNPSITLGDMNLAITRDGWFAQLKRSTLSSDGYDEVPGFKDLAVSGDWFDKTGVIQLQQPSLQVYSQQLFDQDTAITDLSAKVYIDARSNSILVGSKNSEFFANNWPVKVNFEFDTKSDFLSLQADAGNMPLTQVKYLLPNELISVETKDFLSKAFVEQGNITKANVVWHGKLTDFPFDQGNGVFKAKVDIESADFSFSPQWPTLRELDIELSFINKKLIMKSPSSVLGDINISDIRAEIPSLAKNTMLIIDAKAGGSGEQLATLMKNSSLSDDLGRILSEQVVVSGNLQTDLNLTIPLNNIDNVRASGKVNLLGNRVDINALGLKLENANGVLAFDNQNLQAENVDAQLFGQAINLNLISQQSENYDLDIDIQGNWEVEKILQVYAPSLRNSLQGFADFNLAIDVELKDEDYRYQAQLNSNVREVSSDLPFPLRKATGESRPLKIIAQGDNVASSVKVNLDDMVTFEGTLPHKEKRFNRAHLAFGSTDFFSKGIGFSISANLPEMDLNEWYQAIDGVVQQSTSAEHSILGLPERIFIETELLSTDFGVLSDVNIVARRNPQDWTIEINADQARGTIDIHDQWVVSGIVANMDFINLELVPSGLTDNNESNFTAANFPSIDFNCQDCTIGKYQLGKVEIEARPNNDGLHITQILVDNGYANLNAEGQWYQRHQDHYSFIAGDIQSEDFGRALENLDINTGIRDSGAAIDFALTWQNSPIDFDFKNLGGEINWSLSDGYLNEVSDKGSRIFTMLSLNSLLRKLSLDFRDVFAKGFFYDSMQGSVQLTDGKADTRDTVIDGAAGEIEIYGYTDLVSEELNYNVSFAPNVTGNLPVLVYFFTVSPPSALAALAIDQMLTSAKVISNVNYSVTGTIDEPIMLETGRESTEVELPTRRLPEADEQNSPFIPPTEEDLIEIQQDG